MPKKVITEHQFFRPDKGKKRRPKGNLRGLVRTADIKKTFSQGDTTNYGLINPMVKPKEYRI